MQEEPKTFYPAVSQETAQDKPRNLIPNEHTGSRVCYRIAEVAKLTGLSERTIAKLIAMKKLESVKLLRARVVPSTALMKLMATNSTTSSSEPDVFGIEGLAAMKHGDARKKSLRRDASIGGMKHVS